MADETFAGRIALITGAASGIGAATARRLADSGVAGLALTDRDGETLEATAATLARPGLDIQALPFDVADAQAWADAATAIRDRFGRLDLAVANAGIGAGSTIVETSFADWRKVMAVNLDGVFLTLKSAMDLMLEGGAGGAAVVVASAAGVKAEPGTGAYGASKAGAAHLARVAAKEGAANRIRVNAILPGGVETPIWRGVPFFDDLVVRTGGDEAAAFARMAAHATPLGRYAQADEIAGMIAFLLSDACAVVTGESFVCDGGYSL